MNSTDCHSGQALPCPFCGGEAHVEACDRLITIGCSPCGYSRAFSGILQAQESPVRVNDLEFYHPNARTAAIAAWNLRSAQ